MREIIWFFLNLIFIYFISRLSLNEIFYFLRKLIKNEKLVYYFVALIFFPGTIIHEFSHFFAATILFLPVKDIKIFPQIENHSIKLGTVYYIKKDFLRGFLVGIAPLFGAMLFFWVISHLTLNLFFYYLIFVVSTTMFSSKKDLEDLLYLIPFFLFIYFIVYIFNLKIDSIVNFTLNNRDLLNFFQQINSFLILSIIINFVIFAILKLLNYVSTKH